MQSSPSAFATESTGDANQLVNSLEQFKLVDSSMRLGFALLNQGCG